MRKLSEMYVALRIQVFVQIRARNAYFATNLIIYFFEKHVWALCGAITDAEVGNRWFDEPYYSSPFWCPVEPDPKNDGDYITRLRSRRSWTMST